LALASGNLHKILKGISAENDRMGDMTFGQLNRRVKEAFKLSIQASLLKEPML
jgi:hypothetical protein